MRIDVLIPAHDEASLVADTVRAAAAVPGVRRVVVIDDGSADDTAQAAEKAGAEVLRLERNRGKGAALEAGAALLGDAEVVVLLDADLGTSAAEAAKILRPVVDGEADMAIATFPKPAAKAGFGLVKSLARWGIKALSGSEFEASAPLSGQRALTGACLDRIRPFAEGYGVEVALTVRALKSGARIIEVPTQMTHAATGRDAAGFMHRGRQFVHVAAALLRLAADPDRR